MECQAGRLTSVWQKFGGAQSSKVLEAKISTLHLLSTAPDLKKLRPGQAVGRFSSVVKKGSKSNRVAEATKLRKSNGTARSQLPPSKIGEQAETAHRRLCTRGRKLQIGAATLSD